MNVKEETLEMFKKMEKILVDYKDFAINDEVSLISENIIRLLEEELEI